jgi:hypothetical protein
LQTPAHPPAGLFRFSNIYVYFLRSHLVTFPPQQFSLPPLRRHYCLQKQDFPDQTEGFTFGFRDLPPSTFN